jgi:hypothetical protein
MNEMAQLLRYLRASTGNVSLFLGIAALPLMLSVGVATDMIRMNATRTVLQNAADAAAIAGAASNDKTEEFLLKSVNAYLESNNAFHVTQYVTDVDHALDKEKGTFTVKIKGTIPGSFMSLVGFDDLTVGALSVANMGSESLELALVLDNTGSMAGAKIGNLKTAATNLVNTIITESPDTTNIKMAVVPFAQYVNVGKGNHGQGWLNMSTKGSGPWQGCVGPRPKPYDMHISTAGGAYPALAGVDCNAELLPLTSNMVAWFDLGVECT